jgi:hypothetical protein
VCALRRNLGQQAEDARRCTRDAGEGVWLAQARRLRESPWPGCSLVRAYCPALRWSSGVEVVSKVRRLFLRARILGSSLFLYNIESNISKTSHNILVHLEIGLL